MSANTRQHPSEDSETRQKRAENTTIEDVRAIDGHAFDVVDATVFEVDLINEDGERRENVTIIPAILFENTKDVQHRHEAGIVGKYTRALAMENETARSELQAAISAKREEVQEQIWELKEKDARLLHTQADLDGL